MNRRRLFFCATVFASFWVLQPLLAGLFLGAALAFLSEPIKLRLDRTFKVGSSLHKSTAISVAIVVLISVIFLLPFSAVVVGALEQITLSLGSLAASDAVQLLNRVSNQIRSLGSYLPFGIETQQLTSLLSAGAQKALSWLAQNTGRWLTELPAALFTTVLAFFSWGYFLIYGRKFRITLLRFIFPWPEERALMRNTFSRLVKSLVVANIFVSLIQSLIISIFWAFTGIPHILLWTAAAFFLSFIPVIGTAPITVGGALWCWSVADRPQNAIAMLVCAVIAGASDNFIRPLVARGAGDLNPFWLFVAMMGGLSQFGPAGFILGPFALALTISSAAALRKGLKNNHQESQK